VYKSLIVPLSDQLDIAHFFGLGLAPNNMTTNNTKEPFKLSSLLRFRDENVRYPPEVRLWLFCTPTALLTGFATGAFRGAALGNAKARAAIKVRGIAPKGQQ
jgi:hypothetical protein